MVRERYKVIRELDLTVLENAVNQALHFGWELHGSLTVEPFAGTTYYLQILVLTTEE